MQMLGTIISQCEKCYDMGTLQNDMGKYNMEN